MQYVLCGGTTVVSVMLSLCTVVPVVLNIVTGFSVTTATSLLTARRKAATVILYSVGLGLDCAVCRWLWFVMILLFTAHVAYTLAHAHIPRVVPNP